MRPYSDDIRQRILAAIARGEHSLRQIAHLFSVSLSFLVRLQQRQRRDGTFQPRPHGGGPTPRLDDEARQRLLQLVREQPDATLAELRERLGISCSLMTVARALRRQGIRRKKKTRHAQEQDRPEVQEQRAAYEDKMAEVQRDRLIFVDETGATTSMTRRYGRASAGERVEVAVPENWTTVTLIAALRSTEVVAPLAFEGATDTAAFQTYVEKVLVPEIRPGDVVVWDNLQAHKNAEVVAAIEAAGGRVERLPPYSPDKSPLEEMFSKVKESLRTAAARTTEWVVDAIGEALKQVTPSDIHGWFQNRCAYAMH